MVQAKMETFWPRRKDTWRLCKRQTKEGKPNVYPTKKARIHESKKERAKVLDVNVEKIPIRIEAERPKNAPRHEDPKTY